MKTAIIIRQTLLSAFILLTVLLCACGEEPEIVEEEPRSTVFAEQVLPLPDGWSVHNMPTLSFDGAVLSLDIWRETEDGDGDGWPDVEYSTACYSRDGVLLADGASADGAASDTSSGDADSAPAPRHGGRIVRTWQLENGETAAYETLYTDYEVGCWVHLFDADGEVIMTVTPADPFGYDLSRDIRNLSGDVFSVTAAVPVAPAAASADSGDGGTAQNAPCRIGILTTEGFAVYERSGTLSFLIRGGDTPSAVLDTSAGLLYLSESRQGTQSLRRIDTAAGKLGDTVALPEELTATAPGGMTPKLLSGTGFDLYAYNSRGLFGINFADDGMTAVTEPVIDWSLSNLAPSDIRAVCMLDDKTAAIVTKPMLDYTEPAVISLYRMVPPDEIVPKTDLVLAKLCDDYMLQFAVRDFNKTSETHRVVIRDYTQYERDQRKLAFDTDIAAGDIPDLVLLGTSSSHFDTLVPTYERSDLFCDLTPLLQADADFDYDGLLGCITKPYFYNGAQYLFPVMPAQNLWVGHPEDFGGNGGVTYDAFLSVMEDCAARGQVLTSRGDLPYTLVLQAAVQEQYDEPGAPAALTTARCPTSMRVSVPFPRLTRRFPTASATRSCSARGRSGSVSRWAALSPFTVMWKRSMRWAVLRSSAIRPRTGSCAWVPILPSILP